MRLEILARLVFRELSQNFTEDDPERRSNFRELRRKFTRHDSESMDRSPELRQKFTQDNLGSRVNFRELRQKFTQDDLEKSSNIPDICMKRYKAFHRWGEMKSKQVKFLLGSGRVEVKNGNEVLIVDDVPGRTDLEEVIEMKTSQIRDTPLSDVTIGSSNIELVTEIPIDCLLLEKRLQNVTYEDEKCQSEFNNSQTLENNDSIHSQEAGNLKPLSTQRNLVTEILITDDRGCSNESLKHNLIQPNKCQEKTPNASSEIKRKVTSGTNISSSYKPMKYRHVGFAEKSITTKDRSSSPKKVIGKQITNLTKTKTYPAVNKRPPVREWNSSVRNTRNEYVSEDFLKYRNRKKKNIPTINRGSSAKKIDQPAGTNYGRKVKSTPFSLTDALLAVCHVFSCIFLQNYILLCSIDYQLTSNDIFVSFLEF